MAKKKAKTPTKKKKGGGSKKGSMGFDLPKIGGIAAGVWGGSKLNGLTMFTDNITDPKMRAAVKIIGGELLPKQSFVRNAVKNDVLLRGAGDGLIAQGMQELLTEMDLIEGVGSPMNDDDELVVVIEGVDDLDVVNEDVLGDDGDLDVVNEDVLGDDDEDYNDDDDDDGIV